ncbi:hypothetical protein B0J11DRAFT_535004 [Dendryphion nanum]|uniref:DUF7580 domain-containing protein n=1 Tax=Dendryphion nanum TaxID=256645 RepID=A0A9P9DJ93_9PLEO|nr:hypothetical protein B0J11DRAFT_535004 [Dendryphion nanum]
MSGLEIAGVLLGSFPLIISGLEHFRDAAKVRGFFIHVRKEYDKCHSNVEYHEILYKRNLKELLLPIVKDVGEAARLVDDPGGVAWSSKDLEKHLKGRLNESYDLYIRTIFEMNETIEELGKELSFHKATVHDKLAVPRPEKQWRPPSSQPLSGLSKLTAAKKKIDYEAFRIKFSFNNPVRCELLQRLTECNGKLKKLLHTSDIMSALNIMAPSNTHRSHALETAFKKAWKKSGLLFEAFQKAWQCSCQQHHFASLRLEHRTLPEACFEVILTFFASPSQANTLWSLKELQCGQMNDCSLIQKFIQTSPVSPPSPCPSSTYGVEPSQKPRNQKSNSSATSGPSVSTYELLPPTSSSVGLCQLLSNEEQSKCMAIIDCADETYHLHPIKKKVCCNDRNPLTLSRVLSNDFEGYPTRRQRYSIALLLASSIAQLQFTPWINTSLTKDNVFFFPCIHESINIPYHEPFIRQWFPLESPGSADAKAVDCNFSSLGILLLELCFGQRLEDHPFRKRFPVETGEMKETYDLIAALKWSYDVRDEGGGDYSSAVKWCLTGSTKANKFWRAEMIKNVIQPLEKCKECFETVDML